MRNKPSRLNAFMRLMRLNRPIGIYLVLWPTLWALWLAAEGLPDTKLLVIFILGAILMRSAGCVINDFADRNLDGLVQRTRMRPLVTGEVTSAEALLVFLCLCLLAFLLVLLTNKLTILLSLGALGLAATYPFMKRITNLPQVVLGAAFAFSVPMAFAAQTGQVPQVAWLLFIAVVLWTVCYDTFYAMVDRPDDIKAGIKSTAVLLGELDRPMTALLQLATVVTLVLVGTRLQLGFMYYIGIGCAALLFAYQQLAIKEREQKACFGAFMNNNWVGIVIFAGILSHYLVAPLLS